MERWRPEGRKLEDCRAEDGIPGDLKAALGMRPLEPVAGCADSGAITGSARRPADVFDASGCDVGARWPSGTLIEVSILSCFALSPESLLFRTLTDCRSSDAGILGGAAVGGGRAGSCATVPSDTVVSVPVTDILRPEYGIPEPDRSVTPVAFVPTVVR